MILRDSQVFVAGEEPVWRVSAGRFADELDPIHLFAGDAEDMFQHDDIPFLDFELFSADRFAAAADRRRDLVATNPHREDDGNDAVIEDLGLYLPRADLLTPMLRRLASAIAQYVELEVILLHNGPNFRIRPKPSHADMLASPSTPEWLRSFAAAAQPIEDCPHQLADRFAVLAEELHGADLRFDLLGRAEDLACAVQRAVARWESDKALGLLPPVPRGITTAEYDEAIASLV